jgi:capsular exopolysaccharide synthesis family protein
VIDGDLRAPSIHQLFEVPREPGLTEVLAGRSGLQEAIYVTQVDGVDVLSSGTLKGNPHPLFANGRWEQLLRQIPPEYRYVIVDTPPVLAASEALVLARGADAVLLCALRDVTRLPQLQKATERVVSTGAKVAGLILNGLPETHYVNRYGTYSYVSA